MQHIPSWFGRMYLHDGKRECTFFMKSGESFNVSYDYIPYRGKGKYADAKFKVGWSTFYRKNKIQKGCILEFIILPGWWANLYMFEVVITCPPAIQQ